MESKSGKGPAGAGEQRGGPEGQADELSNGTAPQLDLPARASSRVIDPPLQSILADLADVRSRVRGPVDAVAVVREGRE